MHRFGDSVPFERPARPADRALYRRVLGLFAPYRGQVLAVGGTILFTAGVGVVNPLLIKVVFDRALFVPGGPDLTLLTRLVAVMCLLPVIGGAVGVLQTLLANRVGQRVMQDLRNRLYEHLQGMSLRFFTDTRTGEIQSRLANDVAGVQTVLTDTATSILSNIVILISTLVAMVIISWQLTLLSLALVPLFVFLTFRVGTVRRGITADAQKSKAEMSAITQETLSVSGILLSKVFDRRHTEISRFRDENHNLARLQLRQQMVGQGFFAVIQVFFSITPAVTYLVAGAAILGHPGSGVTAGSIVAFTTLQSRLFFPVGQLLQVSVEVQSSLALFQRVFEYLDIPHDIVERPGARTVKPEEVRGEVRLRHVAFRYERPVTRPDEAREAGGHPRTWALRDIDLRIQPGQLAAIVGPSGAGKTTISYLIPRLYDVDEGSVEIDGVDVRDLRTGSLASLVGMVTQESYLFHASVRENLLYARPDASTSEIEAAARAALIHERVTELSDGYDTVVGERGYRLSGGEKQRLAIARVILKNPRILILDEATSALDTASERLVQHALEPLMQDRTTIAIAHRLSTILAADVIFVMDRGRVVERGTHAELLGRGGLYANLFEQQFEGGRIEARCEDGLVLSSGGVTHRPPDGAA